MAREMKYKYKSDGSTLGASGPNIDVEFEYKDIILDDSGKSDQSYVSEKTSVGYNNYSNPYISANFQSYQRDEIYRFFIRFFSEDGRATSPSWIIDLRMPHILDSDDEMYFYDTSDGAKGRIISPKFIIKNFPEGAVAYQILRSERTENDRSVIASGTLRPTFENVYDGDNTTRDDSGYQTAPVSASVRSAFNGGYSSTINRNLVEFYSPEIFFYPEGFRVDGDYFEVLGYLDETSRYSLLDDTSADTTSGMNSYFIKYYDGITESVTTITPTETNIYRSTENILSGDFPETTNFRSFDIGGKTYWTYMVTMEDTDRAARSNSSIVTYFDYEDTEDQYLYTDDHEPFNEGGTKGFDRPMLAIYKRDNYSSMYGGNTYSDRKRNKPLPITSIIDSSTSEIAPYSGDTFISAVDLQPISYEYAFTTDSVEGLSIGEVNIVPLESKVNIELRMGTYASGPIDAESNIKYLNEDGYEDQDIKPLYLYNTVYSNNNNVKEVAILSDEQKGRYATVFNNRVVASENKINGEKRDSWLRYPANNYIDIDSAYGNISKLLKHENKLYFFQERAVGIISVNERSLIQDDSGQQLTLGTGGLLARFDYISTDYGCSDRKSIVDTQQGLYWFDKHNNTLVRMYRDQYGSQQILSLSKEKSVQPFMNKYSFTKCVSGKDKKHDEVLFTLYNDNGDIKTLVYNERVGVFQSLYSVEAGDYIQTNRNLVSVDKDKHNLYVHSRDDAKYSKFNESVHKSSIKLLVNSDIGITKVFDVMNYINQSEDSDGKFIFYDTFDRVRVYDTYQNSDWVDLVKDDTVTKRSKDWSLRVPRNSVTVDLEDNPDIFDVANLDTTKSYKERMRDKYLFVDLEYDNEDNYRFNVPLFITKYRLSYR